MAINEGGGILDRSMRAFSNSWVIHISELHQGRGGRLGFEACVSECGRMAVTDSDSHEWAIYLLSTWYVVESPTSGLCNHAHSNSLYPPVVVSVLCICKNEEPWVLIEKHAYGEMHPSGRRRHGDLEVGDASHQVALGQ